AGGVGARAWCISGAYEPEGPGVRPVGNLTSSDAECVLGWRLPTESFRLTDTPGPASGVDRHIVSQAAACFRLRGHGRYTSEEEKEMTRAKFAAHIIPLLVVVVMPSPASAQSTISGVVRDTSGAVV